MTNDNHEVHNAHHRAFFTGGYEAGGLLNRWATVAAALRVAVLSLASLKLAAGVALLFSSYLAALEVLHGWRHGHPDLSLGSALARARLASQIE